MPRGGADALPLTYRLGPGPGKVHLKVFSNWDMKPLYDVIARIPGSQYPDEWVIRGNHHDAWVNGAEDPISGQMVLLEEARALGVTVKSGWKPKRTIVYCAWDGEEPVCSVPRNGPRRMRMTFANGRWFISIPTLTDAVSSAPKARIRWKGW